MSSDMATQLPASTNVVWHHTTVTRACREAQNGHRGAIIWFTGLPGSGKSRLAHAVEKFLHQRDCRTFVLDDDNVGHGLRGDLGFSTKDHQENIWRIREMTKLFIKKITDCGACALQLDPMLESESKKYCPESRTQP